jgi:hypothetical protein
MQNCGGHVRFSRKRLLVPGQLLVPSGKGVQISRRLLAMSSVTLLLGGPPARNGGTGASVASPDSGIASSCDNVSAR